MLEYIYNYCSMQNSVTLQNKYNKNNNYTPLLFNSAKSRLVYKEDTSNIITGIDTCENFHCVFLLESIYSMHRPLISPSTQPISHFFMLE